VFTGIGMTASQQAEAKKPGTPQAAASISLNQTDPHLGDWVTFAAAGLPNSANSTRVQLICYQGSAMVYGADQPSDTAFLLGAMGSTWLSNGGSAFCHANLYQNGGGGYQFFASADFGAAGAR
jgi:hypothetical protein